MQYLARSPEGKFEPITLACKEDEEKLIDTFQNQRTSCFLWPNRKTGDGSPTFLFRTLNEEEWELRAMSTQEPESEAVREAIQLTSNENVLKYLATASGAHGRFLLSPLYEHNLHYQLHSTAEHFSFSRKDLGTWLKGIVKGLIYLHLNDIYYGAFSTANIRITPQGIVKLTDYDRTIMSVDDDKDGHLLPYMAPEIVTRTVKTKREESPSSSDRKKAHPLSHCDTWSFGIVLWELIAGRKPHENIEKEKLKQTIVDLAATHIAFHPDIIRGSGLEVLEQLLDECWCLVPKDRKKIGTMEGTLQDAMSQVNEMSEEDWQKERSEWRKGVKRYTVKFVKINPSM